MKGLDLFCSSPAATAVCVSMDQKSMVCSGSRAIDRHNPHIMDSRRIRQPNPCSQSSSSSRSYHQKSRKSCGKQIALTSPPGSSRYLLSDPPFFDGSPPELDPVPVSALIPMETTRSRSLKEDCLDPVSALIQMEQQTKSRLFKEDQSAILQPPSTRSHEQVVVLKVSLHCKGCELKVRKHISRMQGVKSFNVDFLAKKVTVIGNVTPLGVLSSISKVKNAQFWPSPAPSSSSSSSSALR